MVACVCHTNNEQSEYFKTNAGVTVKSVWAIIGPGGPNPLADFVPPAHPD